MSFGQDRSLFLQLKTEEKVTTREKEKLNIENDTYVDTQGLMLIRKDWSKVKTKSYTLSNLWTGGVSCGPERGRFACCSS